MDELCRYATVAHIPGNKIALFLFFKLYLLKLKSNFITVAHLFFKSLQWSFLLVVMYLAGTTAADAQAPGILWERSLGGSQMDKAQCIKKTADGGLLIGGYTSSPDGDVSGVHGTQYDFWVVKTNADGTILWQRTMGGSNSELLNSIAFTNDGGYIAAGYSYSHDGDVTINHGNADYWIVKLDDTAGIQWARSFGGSNIDIATCAQQTADSGYIVAGRTFSTDGDIAMHHDSSDCWILKLNPDGSIQWQKTLGGSRGEGASYIQQTIDGGFIVAGGGNSADGDVPDTHGGGDMWVAKLSPTGTVQWEQSLGGTGADNAAMILQTADTGYIVAGSTSSTDGDVAGGHGDYDYWVVKLSAAGAMQWQRCLGGEAGDFATGIVQTPGGGYAVSGVTFSTGGEITANAGLSDMWVVKLSGAGLPQWQRTLGWYGYDAAESIEALSDSIYVVAGYNSCTNDSCISGNHGYTDAWVMKLGYQDTISLHTHGYMPAVGQNSTTIMPNPATSGIKVSSLDVIRSLMVTDALGRRMIERADNRNIVEVDVDALPPGVYMVRVNGITTARFIKK